MEFLTASALSAFAQVVFIDIALAADNAVVIGLAAAGLEPNQRRKAIVWGIIAATVIRIAFASIAVQLLQIVGLALAGGILLVWVCWKMWAELHPEGIRAVFSKWRSRHDPDLPPDENVHDTEQASEAKPKTLRHSILQIIIADISMSLDNVIAVAGAARDHPFVLILGLILSIALMGFAAMAIARLLERHKWIAYVGLGIVFYVAIRMITDGGTEVFHQLSAL